MYRNKQEMERRLHAIHCRITFEFVLSRCSYGEELVSNWKLTKNNRLLHHIIHV